MIDFPILFGAKCTTRATCVIHDYHDPVDIAARTITVRVHVIRDLYLGDRGRSDWMEPDLRERSPLEWSGASVTNVVFSQPPIIIQVLQVVDYYYYSKNKSGTVSQNGIIIHVLLPALSNRRISRELLWTLLYYAPPPSGNLLLHGF